MTDKRKFEQVVTRALLSGFSPIQAYKAAEMKHRRKHGCNMYFNYWHWVRSTRIKIKI